MLAVLALVVVVRLCDRRARRGRSRGIALGVALPLIVLIAEVTSKTLAAKAPLAWARAACCRCRCSRCSSTPVRARRELRRPSCCLRPLGDAARTRPARDLSRAGVPLARRCRLGAGPGRRARAPPDPSRVRVLRQERRPGDDAARSDLRAVVRPADAAAGQGDRGARVLARADLSEVARQRPRHPQREGPRARRRRAAARRGRSASCSTSRCSCRARRRSSGCS